ncbi:MAG TPA: hypothetical protein VEU33_27415 [Archangium sp.]|nr:hypothetical protein [Archangium sp.]
MLVLMLGTGCPVGGEAGVLRQAMLKDLANSLADDGCQPADIEERCGDKLYNACMAACIDKMNKRNLK